MEILIFVGVISGLSLLGVSIGIYGALRRGKKKSPPPFGQKWTEALDESDQSEEKSLIFQEKNQLRKHSIELPGLPAFPFSIRVTTKLSQIQLSFVETFIGESRLSKRLFDTYLIFSGRSTRSFLNQWSGVERLEINFGSRIVAYEAWDRSLLFSRNPKTVIYEAFSAYLAEWQNLIDLTDGVGFEGNKIWSLDPTAVFDALVRSKEVWQPDELIDRARLTPKGNLYAVLYPRHTDLRPEEILPFTDGLDPYYLRFLVKDMDWIQPKLEGYIWRNIKKLGGDQNLGYILNKLCEHGQESFSSYWRSENLWRYLEHAKHILSFFRRFPNQKNLAFLQRMKKKGRHSSLIEDFLRQWEAQAGYLDLSDDEGAGHLKLQEGSQKRLNCWRDR